MPDLIIELSEYLATNGDVWPGGRLQLPLNSEQLIIYFLLEQIAKQNNRIDALERQIEQPKKGV